MPGRLQDCPRAAGRVPVLGHLPRLRRDVLGFLCGLPADGDIVRVDLGPHPLYVVTAPELVHAILADREADFTRGRLFERLVPLFGNGITVSEGEAHRTHRRLMMPAFRRERVAGYVPTIAQIAGEAVDAWLADGRVELHAAARRLATTMVSSVVFGVQAGRSSWETVDECLRVIGRYVPARTIMPRGLDWLPLPMNTRFDASARRLRALVDDIVTEHVRRPAADFTLVGMLLALDPPLTREQLRDELIGMLTASTETTAITLAWFFHELLTHPEMHARAAAEVASVVGDRTPTPEDLPELTYVNRLLTETMRLHSQVFFNRRAIRDTVIGEFAVPEGMELTYSLYALHRHPRLYPDPTAFDPDRWLPERAASAKVYFPFSLGRHRCIGENLAWNEMLTVIATVLGRTRITADDGYAAHEVVGGMPRPSAVPVRVAAR